MESLAHGWWECKMIQPPWKKIWQFLLKLNMQISYNPITIFLGV